MTMFFVTSKWVKRLAIYAVAQRLCADPIALIIEMCRPRMNISQMSKWIIFFF